MYASHHKKHINEEINDCRFQKGILQYESPFGLVPTAPLLAWDKVGIFYSCFSGSFSLCAPAFGFSNGWTRWGFEKKHSNSNILISLFWGCLLSPCCCVCMRQRGVCSAMFKKEPLIFLCLSVCIIRAFIFIFYLFLTLFPPACHSLSFGMGFFQSFQNNYTTWSPSLLLPSFLPSAVSFSVGLNIALAIMQPEGPDSYIVLWWFCHSWNERDGEEDEREMSAAF